jgi:hypothetical protein
MRQLLSVALFLAPAFGYYLFPPDLFSPLISQKLFATAQLAQSLPGSYPQYTTRDTGEWLFFGADTWTSGFLPATLYALAERAALCPNSMYGTTRKQWLDIARSSATGEIPLELHTSVGHDVGFLSLPFVDELAVYEISYPYLYSFPGSHIIFTHQQSTQQNCTARRRSIRRCVSGPL